MYDHLSAFKRLTSVLGKNGICGIIRKCSSSGGSTKFSFWVGWSILSKISHQVFIIQLILHKHESHSSLQSFHYYCLQSLDLTFVEPEKVYDREYICMKTRKT